MLGVYEILTVKTKKKTPKMFAKMTDTGDTSQSKEWIYKLPYPLTVANVSVLGKEITESYALFMGRQYFSFTIDRKKPE